MAGKSKLSNNSKRKRISSNRSSRYGKLVRGWGWRTTKELLEQAESARLKMKLNKTEFLERALKELIAK